jgi:hypothetical protein
MQSEYMNDLIDRGTNADALAIEHAEGKAKGRASSAKLFITSGSMPHEQVIAMLSLIGEEIGVSDSLSAPECAGDAGQMSKPRD